MAEVDVKQFDSSHQSDLLQLLTENEWPFHSTSVLSREKVNTLLSDGYYQRQGVITFSLYVKDVYCGLIRLFDLGKDENDDETPLFDIRIAADLRGQGVGSASVKWLTDYVFNTFPNKRRLEATTRCDNIGMRKVLEKNHFVQEAQYRQAWPLTKSGPYTDAVGYGLLRSDWESQKATPVEFNY